jgi:diadenosine tetraphosphate (Ap4A) HIT family hydrolase
LIRGWGSPRVTPTVSCRWCDLLEAVRPVVYEEEAYVLLTSGVDWCARNNLTLMPKSHVEVITELPAEEMTAVLAGLSKLSSLLRQAYGVDRVDIWAHPKNPFRHTGHLHFHPVPKTVTGIPVNADPVDGPLMDEVVRVMARG